MLNDAGRELLSLRTARRDGRCELFVAGEVDLSTAESLSEVAHRQLEAGPLGLALDLREVTFMDATGVRVLLMLKQRADELDRGLSIIVQDSQVSRILEITGVSAMLPIERAGSQNGASPAMG